MLFIEGGGGGEGVMRLPFKLCTRIFLKINTVGKYDDMKSKQYSCDPYDLYGDQA